MFLDIVLLLIGIAIVIWGADKFTDGASSMARRWNVSEMVIGLTVVAMGTSMPEFLQRSGGQCRYECRKCGWKQCFQYTAYCRLFCHHDVHVVDKETVNERYSFCDLLFANIGGLVQ